MARVLLVDDDAAVRTFVRRALERRGHIVLAMADGESGKAALDRGDAIDLVLTDIVMPGVDGLDVAAYARRTRSGVPVVLMTGYASAAQRRDLEAAPHLPLLVKPFRLHTLYDTVENLLAGHASHDAR